MTFFARLLLNRELLMDQTPSVRPVVIRPQLTPAELTDILRRLAEAADQCLPCPVQVRR